MIIVHLGMGDYQKFEVYLALGCEAISRLSRRRNLMGFMYIAIESPYIGNESPNAQ